MKTKKLKQEALEKEQSIIADRLKVKEEQQAAEKLRLKIIEKEQSITTDRLKAEETRQAAEKLRLKIIEKEQSITTDRLKIEEARQAAEKLRLKITEEEKIIILEREKIEKLRLEVIEKGLTMTIERQKNVAEQEAAEKLRLKVIEKEQTIINERQKVEKERQEAEKLKLKIIEKEQSIINERQKVEKERQEAEKLKLKIIEKEQAIIDVRQKVEEEHYKKVINLNNRLKKQNEEYETLNEALKKAKEKAEESDQLKTEFINNMSHEIRTPLNGILGFAQFLNSPDLTEKTRKQYVDIINNSSNQLLKIIEDILEISQLTTKQVKINEKEICLNDLLLELFSIFDIKAKENKTPLYLNKGLSDNESVILTDKIKLNKILSNLLENALKFTTEGFIEFGYQLKDSKLEIYVKDTGIGIKQESQKTIFDRFSQEEKELSQKVGGLGLGLAIAKENAELLGGKITLHSKKEEGATFYVTIPYKPVNSKTGNDNSSINKTKRTKIQDNYTILIVEDEEVNYLYLDILLGKFELDFETLHAKHGKEAVEICKKNDEIDFVLMDMKMPIMNGYEATKLIKEFRPVLPIVAQTAYSTNDEQKQAFSVGCDDFISKPINKINLKRIMNKYLIMKE